MNATAIASRTAHTGRIRLSDAAEQYLDRLADAVQTGDVQLWQLPPSLHAWHAYGYHAGRHSRDPEVAALRRELDHWYLVANNPPAEVKRILARRVDAALEAESLAWFENGGDTIADRLAAWAEGGDR